MGSVRSKKSWPFSDAIPTRVWRLAEHCLYATTHLYCDTPSENFVLSMMVQRSWAWNRYEETMMNQVFQFGSPKARAFPIPYGRVQIWRARSALRDKGILMWENPGSNRVPTPHIINLPGLCASWRMLAEKTDTLSIWRPLLIFENRFIADFVKAKIDYPKRVTEAKMIKEIEDGMDHGVWTSKKAVQKKRAKHHKVPKKDINVSWIPDFFRECCEDHDMDYYEKWTKVERGMARNWINECIENGADPRDVIRMVVENWQRFRSNLFRDDNSTVMLSPVVSFRVFYTYRAQIHEWLLIDGRDKHDEYVQDSEDKASVINVLE